ncbi:hypothetical protein Leryth_009568 [Lithospermum erythrorhizon]|nr:hypothetical protein Leryth_009568 [Lithospermum erythrorhizon]
MAPIYMKLTTTSATDSETRPTPPFRCPLFVAARPIVKAAMEGVNGNIIYRNLDPEGVGRRNHLTVYQNLDGEGFLQWVLKFEAFPLCSGTSFYQLSQR